MDTLAMEGVIRLLIQGTEAIGEALQLALMQYQDRAGEEQIAAHERSNPDGKQQ